MLYEVITRRQLPRPRAGHQPGRRHDPVARRLAGWSPPKWLEQQPPLEMVALDNAPGMLEQARAKAAEASYNFV